jgi:sec-independent protein translocase protein TatA
MFGLGIWEIVIIAIVALLVLGPERLPKMARQVADGLREFRRAANDLQRTLEEAAHDIDAETRAPLRDALKSAEGAVATTESDEPKTPP